MARAAQARVAAFQSCASVTSFYSTGATREEREFLKAIQLGSTSQSATADNLDCDGSPAFDGEPDEEMDDWITINCTSNQLQSYHHLVQAVCELNGQW
jgi:hypothetical protein